MRLPKITFPRLRLPGYTNITLSLTWLSGRFPRWIVRVIRKPNNITLLILLVIVGVSGLAWNNQRDANSEKGFKLRSPSFDNRGILPAQFTCDGDNLSPEFNISGVPKKAKSLAFIVEDKDIDTKHYQDTPYQAHMIVWNIPTTTTKFNRGIRPPGTIGRNIFGNFAFGGPCPPEGETHKYTFTLYAIEKDTLPINPETGLAEAKKAIVRNSIAKTKLTARYTRIKK